MLERTRRRLIKQVEVRSIGSIPFSIISNNCWGYEIYKRLGRPYNTPFVGLYLFPTCYLKLLADFESIFDWNLEFIECSQYFRAPVRFPIGVLSNGSEIHFMHYESENEAREKWFRRLDRLQRDHAKGCRLLFKFCDAENARLEDIENFHELARMYDGYSVSFGLCPASSRNHLCVPKFKEEGRDNVLSGKKLFDKRYEMFDFLSWVNRGVVKTTLRSRILSMLMI